MRKRVVQGVQTSTGGTLEDWSLLPIETIAEVEVSSEDPNAPIDAALSCVAGSGWRAGMPGEQRVAILFDQPERVRRIALKFVEAERPRTQEFVLTWSSQVGTPAHLIVRQQWTFSPEASTTEQETYEVTLDNVGVLQLLIKPDLSDHTVFATLAEWRVFGER